MGLCLSGLPVSLRVVADGQLYALEGGQIADGSRGDEFALVHVSASGGCPVVAMPSASAWDALALSGVSAFVAGACLSAALILIARR